MSMTPKLRNTTCLHTTSLVCAAVIVGACANSPPAEGAGSPDLTPAAGEETDDIPDFIQDPNTDHKRAVTECPMRLADVRVSALPNERGVIIVFASNEAPKEELLRRVQLFAEGYDGDAVHVATDAPPIDVPTRSEFEETAIGIRVSIAAQQPEHVETLQEHLMDRTREMQETNDCPWMTGQ